MPIASTAIAQSRIPADGAGRILVMTPRAAELQWPLRKSARTRFAPAAALGASAWLITAGCGSGPGANRTATPGAFEVSGVVEARLAHVGSRTGGRVVAVAVEEGQTVEPGAVLVRLEARELEAERGQLLARRDQARAAEAKLAAGFRPEEIEQAQANARREAAVLDAIRNGPRPQELQQAEAEHAAAAAEAANAQAAWERIGKLYASGDFSRHTRDDAESRRNLTAKRAEAALGRLDLLRAGSRTEDIAAAEARAAQANANARLLRQGFRAEEIAEARARLRETEALLRINAERLAEMEVRAPSAARVETVSVRPGDVAAANRVVATLLEPGQIWVRGYVPEPLLGRVKTGQRAQLEVDTFPGRRFRGEVVQIASQSEFLPRNIQTREDRNYQLFSIRIRPLEGLDLLKPGMAVAITLE
jgi:multidrug resistance efflux pump